MKGKTTLNEYLIYSFCAICFLWSIYLLFFSA
jgi:hypothetical protein